MPESTRDRGPLRSAAWIAEHLAGGAVSEDWIRRKLPAKRKLSRKVAVWYEQDAREGLATLLAGAGGTHGA